MSRSTQALVVALPLVALVAFVLARANDVDDAPLTAADGATRDVCTVEARPAPLPSALRETSGIAHTRDGALWTHNDGAEARLYRLDQAGAVAQVVALDGVAAVDLEDIEASSCPDGSGECLWLADTGDNEGERTMVALLVVPVPDSAASRARARSIPVRWPSPPRDAEALAVLPDGSALLVTKGRGTPIEVLRVNGAAGEGTRPAELLRTLAAEPARNRDRVAGAAASEDGAWVALRTNDALAVYRAADIVRPGGEPALTFDLRPLGESQGEGVELTSDGRVWLTSEAGGDGRPTLARLRCPLPE